MVEFLPNEAAAKLPELYKRLGRIAGLGFTDATWYDGKFVIQLDSHPPEHAERMLRKTAEELELGEFEISLDP